MRSVVGGHLARAPEAAARWKAEVAQLMASDAVGLHGPQQQQREGEELPGIDVACGAQLQRLVDVLHRQIKVKGRLDAEDLVAGIAAEGRHPFGKVNDAAVGDHNALGRAGGAGGEENIHRVHVQHPAAAALQQRLVRLGGARLLRGQRGQQSASVRASASSAAA